MNVCLVDTFHIFGTNGMKYDYNVPLQVSGRISELKTTIDAGLLHRRNLLQTIGEQYDRWNILVSC